MAAFNCYEDARRAEAYARLEFPGTYYLAYRDLPALFAEHVRGRRAGSTSAAAPGARRASWRATGSP